MAEQKESLRLKNKHLPTAEKIYHTVDEMPFSPSGEEALLQFISTNIKYPEAARNADIEGICVVEFVVEKDGDLTNVKILRSISGNTDEEVVRIIGLMPKW